MKSSIPLKLLRWITVLPLLIVLFASIAGIESPRLDVATESAAGEPIPGAGQPGLGAALAKRRRLRRVGGRGARRRPRGGRRGLEGASGRLALRFFSASVAAARRGTRAARAGRRAPADRRSAARDTRA